MVKKGSRWERDRCGQGFSDEMQIGVIWVNGDGMVETFSRTAESMFGVPATAVLGRSLAELGSLVSVPDLEFLVKADYLVDWGMRLYGKVVRVKKTSLFDSRARTDGQLIILSSVEESCFGDGLKGLSVEAAIKELAAVVVHEVRNPLAAIRGFAQMSQERLVSGEPVSEKTVDQVVDFLEVVVGEADRLNGIATQFAVLADLECLLWSAVDLNEVVCAARDRLRPEFEERAVEACFELQDDLPLVLGDESLLRRAVENLGRNGIQAAGPGGRVVFRTTFNGSDVVLEVADTGPGVSAELQERIFVPFFTTFNGQIGLGLAACKHVMRRHGGRIAVRNSFPGVVFTISLPALDSAELKLAVGDEG